MSKEWVSPEEKAKYLLEDSVDEFGEERVEKAVRLLEDGPFMSRKPGVQAAAAMYVVVRPDEDILQQEVADHFGISAHSVRDAERQIREYFGEDELYEMILGKEKPTMPKHRKDESNGDDDDTEKYARLVDRLREATADVDTSEYEPYTEPEVGPEDTLADVRTEHGAVFQLIDRWSIEGIENRSIMLSQKRWSIIRTLIDAHMHDKGTDASLPPGITVRHSDGVYSVESQYEGTVALPGNEWMELLDHIMQKRK